MLQYIFSQSFPKFSHADKSTTWFVEEFITTLNLALVCPLAVRYNSEIQKNVPTGFLKTNLVLPKNAG